MPEKPVIAAGYRPEQVEADTQADAAGFVRRLLAECKP